MCADVTKASLPPGRSEYIEKAWELKEDIREEIGIFHYSKDFFENIYTNEFVYTRLSEDETKMLGFAIVRKRGYMSLLAVKEQKRGKGLGQALVRDSLNDFDELECTVRDTNKKALSFYEGFGFEIDSIEEQYYDNDDDGFHMIYEDT